MAKSTVKTVTAEPTAKRGRPVGFKSTVVYGGPEIDFSAFEAAPSAAKRGRAAEDWAAKIASADGKVQTLVSNITDKSASTYMTKFRKACKDANIVADLRTLPDPVNAGQFLIACLFRSADQPQDSAPAE